MQSKLSMPGRWGAHSIRSWEVWNAREKGGTQVLKNKCESSQTQPPWGTEHAKWEQRCWLGRTVWRVRDNSQEGPGKVSGVG